MSKITLEQIEEAIQSTMDSMEEGMDYVISEAQLAKINETRREMGWKALERSDWCWKKKGGKLYESGDYMCEATETEMVTEMAMAMVTVTVTAMVTVMAMVMVFMLGEIEPKEKDLTLGDLELGDLFSFVGDKTKFISVVIGRGKTEIAIECNSTGLIEGASPNAKVRRIYKK